MGHVTLDNIRVGSTVIVRGGFGTEAPKQVVIEDIDEEGKNDRPTIGYGDRWAYVSQIVRVVQY